MVKQQRMTFEERASQDRRDSIAISGDAILKEWAQHERVRFPGWPTANSLWLASHGAGGGPEPEHPLPQHLEVVERGVRALPPTTRFAVIEHYIKSKRPREIAVSMNLSVRSFWDRLKTAQVYIAGRAA